MCCVKRADRFVNFKMNINFNLVYSVFISQAISSPLIFLSHLFVLLIPSCPLLLLLLLLTVEEFTPLLCVLIYSFLLGPHKKINEKKDDM